MSNNFSDIRLTQFSHGAGCGCKLSPAVLDKILHTNEAGGEHPHLLVGNSTRDDAAVFDLGNGQGLISTTDFFMPIVDDPFDFGRIASANAISDVYAMGGTPIMAIAILGWTVDKLPPEIAAEVIRGSRAVCAEAGIPLAGGHSIDSPEPIFGLAVNGLVDLQHLKQNSTATEGSLLYLTKGLGVGILTTAEKNGTLKAEHRGVAAASMTRINSIGAELARIPGVAAMTDVTGFGFLGHLLEMCNGSSVSATVSVSALPCITDVSDYVAAKCTPGGTKRNWLSYGKALNLSGDSPSEQFEKHYETLALLCDPQTSGGLLVAVTEDSAPAVEACMIAHGLGELANPVGRITKRGESAVTIA